MGLLALGVTMRAAEPPQNVDPARHPKLAEVQSLIKQAFDKLDEAQRSNDWDMGGHAQKAKELLKQADQEIKLAAITINKQMPKDKAK